MKNDIGQHYLCNYCPKLEKLNPWPPKPLNIHIGEFLFSNGTIESPKKSHASATLLLAIFAKFDNSNVAQAWLFLDFQCICCYKVTLLYVYLVVWGVTDWAFFSLGQYYTNSVDLCNFSCFLAQLSPIIMLAYTVPQNRGSGGQTVSKQTSHLPLTSPLQAAHSEPISERIIIIIIIIVIITILTRIVFLYFWIDY